MRHNTNTIKAFALSAIAALSLNACHSSERHLIKEEPVPIEEPTPYNVKVSDGYLNGDFVFLDLNSNYKFDDGEPSGTTGAGGAVALDVEGIENPELYSIIALATQALTVDEDTGCNVESDFAMSSPPGTVVVNPVTTLVHAKIAGTTATAVHQAIALGKDPDVILVIVETDGKEFIADIRTWGNEIALEMATPAAGFSGKLDAASLLVESDIDSLVMIFNDVLMKIDQASMQEHYRN